MHNTLGNNIRKYRERANLSQEQLAEKLHFSQQQISYWEHGKRLPSIDTIMDIAKVLHVHYSNLLFPNTGLDWFECCFNGKWWMYKIDNTNQLLKDCQSSNEWTRIFAETMLKVKKGRSYYEVMLTPDEHDIYIGLLSEGIMMGVIPFCDICSRPKWKRLREQRLIQQSVVGKET